MKLIGSLIFATVACASLSAAFPTYGHETVSEDWCVDGNTTPVILSRFKWSKEELLDVGQSCGIVDIGGGDAWGVANGIVSAYCQTQSERAVPFIVGPESYNNKSHHETYQLEDGIAGSCAVCVPHGHKR